MVHREEQEEQTRPSLLLCMQNRISKTLLTLLILLNYVNASPPPLALIITFRCLLEQLKFRFNALKGQQYVSPGHRPGYADKCDFRPVRAKDLYLMTILLPLQGVYMAVICYPGGFQDGTITCSIWETCPGLTSHCPFGALSY